MILRYFYIQKYNTVAENININLGGRYKFTFEEQDKNLHVVMDNTYVENLYGRFDTISDISALLGKNGSGKTTVLRMINLIFNKFYNMDDTNHIIIFEYKSKYYMYTNIDNVLVDNDGITINRSNSLPDMIKDIGLIYFSGIFDKATPFQGNANLIDISTNFEFENFYKKNRNTLSENILSDYRLKCMIEELGFLISLNNEFNAQNFSPLFKTPGQIEIGFWLDEERIEEVDKKSTIANIMDMLKQTIDMVSEYFSTEDNNSDEKKKFLQETLFYILIDELYYQIYDERYNVENALNYLIDNLSEHRWDIDNYFDIVLDQLFYEEGVIRELELDYVISKRDKVYTFSDIVQEMTLLQDKICSFNFPDWEQVKNNINRYIIFFQNKIYDQDENIISGLGNIVMLIGELQDDLHYADYDLYSIEILMDICNELESVQKSIGDTFDFEPIDDLVDETDANMQEDEDFNIEEAEKERDIDNRLESIKKLKIQICKLTEKNRFNKEERLIQLKLNDESILDFIKNFIELEFKLAKISIKRNDISSGHSAYIDMCSRLNIARKSGEIVGKKYVILLIDEGDIYLHPEMQLKFINNLLKLVQMMFSEKKVQLVLTSNSPFIVSDIQKSNIVYLEKCNENIDMKENNFIDNCDNCRISAVYSKIYNTFAANVNDLLQHSFFVNDGLFGEYSIEVINDIIKLIREGKEKNNISEDALYYVENVISIIGEPLIKKKLENMFFSLQQSHTSREIEYYKKRIKDLEKINKGGKNGKC